MESAPNPYAAPQTETEAPSAETIEELVAIRKKHINAEASIKSIGSLDYFGSVITIISAFVALFPLPSSAFGIGRAFGAFVAGAGVGVGSFYLGFKIRELNPTARVVQTALLVPGALLSLPMALLWSLLIAYILWSSKARVVFSEHYRTVVIPATPEIKYRSSLILVIGVLLLILILGAVTLGLFAGTHR